MLAYQLMNGVHIVVHDRVLSDKGDMLADEVIDGLSAASEACAGRGHFLAEVNSLRGRHQFDRENALDIVDDTSRFERRRTAHAHMIFYIGRSWNGIDAGGV